MPSPRKPSRTLADIPVPQSWSPPFDEAICWRGGSEAQYMRHKRRGEEPCTNCTAAAVRIHEDRARKHRQKKARLKEDM